MDISTTPPTISNDLGWKFAVTCDNLELTLTDCLEAPSAPTALNLGDPVQGGYEITAITSPADRTGGILDTNHVKATCLTLPPTLRDIGNYAFYYCTSLRGWLALPDSVTSIGDGVFAGCFGFMGSLTLGNSVTSIGDRAFYYCNGFTGPLTIPNSVTSIGDSAFYQCSGFKGSLTIGNSVTNIGPGAFYNCNGFTGPLVIPNSVTSIGGDTYGAFESCHGFTSLTLGNSVTHIGTYAFYLCRGFTGPLIIPDSVTYIGGDAFYDTRFPQITTPFTGVSFGNYAFAYNPALTNVTFTGGYPKSVGNYHYSGSPAVTSYVFSANATLWDPKVTPPGTLSTGGTPTWQGAPIRTCAVVAGGVTVGKIEVGADGAVTLTWPAQGGAVMVYVTDDLTKPFPTGWKMFAGGPTGMTLTQGDFTTKGLGTDRLFFKVEAQ